MPFFRLGRLHGIWFGILFVLGTGCASSDTARIKASREAYLRDDFESAEKELYSPEVYKNAQNRLLQFYLLSSVALSEGQYEKALLFLEKARAAAITVHSDNGSFDLFSNDYKGSPLEYSTLHGMMVMANSMLASQGKTPAWSTPEIKDSDGNILVAATSAPEKVYTPREMADFRQKARSELMAWDSFLETLKRTYPDRDFYHEDLWARILASFVHGISDDPSEKRTAELLAGQAADVLEHTRADLPSRQEQTPQIKALIDQLTARAQGKSGGPQSLLVVEAGVMSKLKIRRFHLGLSTIFKNVQDPRTRRQIEAIGMYVLLRYAPEFGLIALGGAVAGAIDSEGAVSEDEEYEGPARYFTDAIDRSFGFDIELPTIAVPPPDTRVHLYLSKDGKTLPEMLMPVVSPMQEILSRELQKRQDKEMFDHAIKIGVQYLVVLVPAVIAYSKTKNWIEKLAIIAGYYIAKKVVDGLNHPDLRSWNTLPMLIAAQVPSVPPGTYTGRVVIENHFGQAETALGTLELGNPNQPILHRRVGNLSILNRRTVDRHRVY